MNVEAVGVQVDVFRFARQKDGSCDVLGVWHEVVPSRVNLIPSGVAVGE